MSNLSHFLSLFEHTEAKVTEQFDELTIVLNAESHKNVEGLAFSDGLRFLNDRDKLSLSFVIDGGESVDYYSGNDPEDFLSSLRSKLSIVEEEKIEILIRVSKELKEGIISVYSYPDFLRFLEGLTTQALFFEFNFYLQKGNFLIFEHQNDGPIVVTSSIWWVNRQFSGLPNTIDRTIITSRAKTSCHYNFLSKFSLLPQDFSIISSECPKLENLLGKCEIILSIIYLYDITNLQNNVLEYRLNGYKSISGKADLSHVMPDSEHQYFNIFTWVYDSGNFVDKLGLARNIISLHLESKDRIELKGDPYRSIQSSYKVYEKQNIRQYIEIRNKISDQLLSFHDRANKIIETFASGFQKSAFALITFYISAIILKVLNKDKLIEVFTIDAAVLSTAFILCSIVYYLVLKWEVKAQRNRFERNYRNVKRRYTDLLDEQDIIRILNHDHEFLNDVAFIKDKEKNYSIMWFVFLAIFFITTWLLYFIYNPKLIIIILSWLQPCSSTCSL